MNNTKLTDIQQFYSNKCVFLTGGTGFLGKVFIEKLLRVTDVQHIYVLVRPKKGKDIRERLNDLFNDALFEKLRKLKPNAYEKIIIIAGDCMMPKLGISEQDRQILCQNIDIVVNSAATVRFNEPLSTALAINLRATVDLLQLATDMQQLKAFVHVSSAFANCTQSFVDEKYYTEKIGLSAKSAVQLLDILSTDILDRIPLHELCNKFPNTYCLTKALAEEAVLTQGRNLPICIFRPGIVIPTCREPVSGWSDNLYGPISIVCGAAYGVLRVMYLRIEANANVVPVDFCANMMAVCAWKTSQQRQQQQQQLEQQPTTEIEAKKHLPAPIYNLVPHERNALKWAGFNQAVEKYGHKMPLTRMLWFPFVKTTDSKLIYKILIFLYHTIPGYFFDFLLMLMGKERRLVKTYEKIHKQQGLLQYFADRDWTFSTKNTDALWQSMSSDDQRLFLFDMLSIDWHEYFYHAIYGMRIYLTKEDPSTIPKAVKLFDRLFILHRATQFLIYGGGLAALWWTIF